MRREREAHNRAYYMFCIWPIIIFSGQSARSSQIKSNDCGNTGVQSVANAPVATFTYYIILLKLSTLLRMQRRDAKHRATAVRNRLKGNRIYSYAKRAPSRLRRCGSALTPDYAFAFR